MFYTKDDVIKAIKNARENKDIKAIAFVDEKNDGKICSTGFAVISPKNNLEPKFLNYLLSSEGYIDHVMANSVGVIDSGYRGEIMFKFSRSDKQYSVGERIGQILILPYPHIEFEEVHELSKTNRGTGGFGSTGEK